MTRGRSRAATQSESGGGRFPEVRDVRAQRAALVRVEWCGQAKRARKDALSLERLRHWPQRGPSRTRPLRADYVRLR